MTTLLNALQPPALSVRPLNEEAPFLDERLGRYVRHRLWCLDRKFLDVEDADDIKNTSWSKALGQHAFVQGCTGVRVTYLRTTANRHILNLIRKDEQRPAGLKKSWDKAINGWCVVHARDVWDHVAFLFGAGEDVLQEGYVLGLMPRPDASRMHGLAVGSLQRITDLPIDYLVLRALNHIWHEAACGYGRCTHYGCYRHYRWFWHRWHHCFEYCRNHSAHPVCAGMHLFYTVRHRVELAEALRIAAEFVQAQVSLKVAQDQGDPHERDSDCCRRCCRWFFRHCRPD